MRCALIEAETRDEVLREMEARMRKMEEMYSRRLMNEVKIISGPRPSSYLKSYSGSKMS